jgi:catechol 2,3-dioxygenase-like lactoylglutathione lyase family enzyme
MSPNIAIRTSQFSDAVNFYTKVIGFENRSEDPELADLDANPLNIFIIEDDESRGPVLELFVDDLEAARQELVANGCKVLRWRGKGQDCYIEDPFGVIYNIWEG